jgi:hypothetical protein
MKWICFKDHYMPNAWGFSLTPQPRECGTFREWLLCQVMWHGPEVLKRKLAEIGFIDAENEGGIAFWRLDFWNSKMRAQFIAHERREWERKRAEAIARWGEGAG